MTKMVGLRGGGGVLGVTAVLLFLLVALGTFDPQPVGKLAWTSAAATQTAPRLEKQISWLVEEIPLGDFTIRTTVTHESGELDSGAGLVFGDEGTAVIIAISPLGYVTIQQDEPITADRLPMTEMPWQPWPHLKTGSEANELWVDVVDGQMRVRINRELLWSGAAPFQPTQLGLYGESFGDTAVFHFQQIELFTDTK
ncbi:MAG: hypothetical protein HC804_10945 [Anaerolineae bacterium]|nr:hypothetical protein [Anaerolineae bacterium]